jgi:serine-type D-Ala-D-Ala carboxypeptidase (penicillin-binding protein 5/6)
MLNAFRLILALVLASPWLVGTTLAQSFETTAKHAILYDFESRAVLFERQARVKIAPASLVKVMTAALVFREMKEGRLSPEREMVVSADAWRRGGAVSGGPNMLLVPGRRLKVSELLQGLIVGAANDAAITLAENLAGTEAKFVEQMNAYAREIGLSHLAFRNATGFMAGGQEASLHDLVQLSAHLITTYPEQYALFAQRDMPLGRNRQVSRNPLLSMDIGADGLMTGSAPDYGHALLGSAVQDGRRLIIGLAGVETIQERGAEARKLLEWGFRRFETRTLFDAGSVIGEVALYGAAQSYLPVKTVQDIRLPVLRGSGDGASLRLVYRGPVSAPIRAGQEVARLEALVEGRVIQSSPLVATVDVAQGGVIGRAQDAAIELSRQGVAKGFRWVLEKIGLAKKPADPASAGTTGGGPSSAGAR